MGERHEHDGVAVRRRFHRLLHRDDAAGAAPVVGDHLLAEPIAKLGGNEAGDDVDAAARSKRNDEPYRPGRIVLRLPPMW